MILSLMEGQGGMMECRREDHCEKCCLCHKELEIPKDRPVQDREIYIEGAGQLCGVCYYEVYGSALNHRPGSN